MDRAYFLKLRSNIAVQGDAELAKREISGFFKEVIPVTKPEVVQKYIHMATKCIISNVRKQEPIGFICINPCKSISEIIKLSSFIQEVWFANDGELKKFPKASWWNSKYVEGKHIVCAVPMMAAAEFLSYLNSEQPTENDLFSITSFLSGNEPNAMRAIVKSINRMQTSTPHVHGIHRYKAKFFPRMIRSFLISCFDGLPKNSKGKLVLLDPFVGSGTALVEAKLLGIESIGIDIDPLSCSISTAKIELMNADVETLNEAIHEFWKYFEFASNSEEIQQEYSFPPWIAKKFDKPNKANKHNYTSEGKKQYEHEIAIIKNAISKVKSESIRLIFEICFSDAINRKFNIRMMGTGVGRFALEIRNMKLSKMMESNLQYALRAASVCLVIKKSYNLNMAQSRAINDTATKMPLSQDSVSIILTSPPYLPASSGREGYLIGKSISITALGLMTAAQISDSETKSVGSMKSNGESKQEEMPKEVINLYNWLKSDELRAIKAQPTISYYQSLRKSLLESNRALLPNGVAIYVIGKESVFYNFSTRKVLYRVACDDIFQELAISCGFNVENRVDVELDKKNANARPRSLDTYYETVFILRKSPNS